MVKITVGVDDWYLEKIDSTHFRISNDPDRKGVSVHVGQYRSEPYYEDVKDWLHGKKEIDGAMYGL